MPTGIGRRCRVGVFVHQFAARHGGWAGTPIVQNFNRTFLPAEERKLRSADDMKIARCTILDRKQLNFKASMRITRIFVHRVDLPLKAVSYKWFGGKSVTVFDRTLVDIS